MRTKALIPVLAALVLGLSGCYESTQVTVHKPGDYKGAKDPLLSQQGSTRADALRKRFELVQLDR